MPINPNTGLYEREAPSIFPPGMFSGPLEAMNATRATSLANEQQNRNQLQDVILGLTAQRQQQQFDQQQGMIQELSKLSPAQPGQDNFGAISDIAARHGEFSPSLARVYSTNQRISTSQQTARGKFLDNQLKNSKGRNRMQIGESLKLQYPDWADDVDKWVSIDPGEVAPADTAALDLSDAKTGEAQSKGSLEEERGTDLRMTREARIAHLRAQSSLASAEAAAAPIRAEAARMIATGDVRPRDLVPMLDHLHKQIGDAEKLASMLPADPQTMQGIKKKREEFDRFAALAGLPSYRNYGSAKLEPKPDVNTKTGEVTGHKPDGTVAAPSTTTTEAPSPDGKKPLAKVIAMQGDFAVIEFPSGKKTRVNLKRPVVIDGIPAVLEGDAFVEKTNE